MVIRMNEIPNVVYHNKMLRILSYSIAITWFSVFYLSSILRVRVRIKVRIRVRVGLGLVLDEANSILPSFR